jgi:hypothetical protein
MINNRAMSLMRGNVVRSITAFLRQGPASQNHFAGWSNQPSTLEAREDLVSRKRMPIERWHGEVRIQEVISLTFASGGGNTQRRAIHLDRRWECRIGIAQLAIEPNICRPSIIGDHHVMPPLMRKRAVGQDGVPYSGTVANIENDTSIGIYKECETGALTLIELSENRSRGSDFPQPNPAFD